MNSKSLKEFLVHIGNAEDWKLFHLRLKAIIRGDSQILSLWFSYKIARFTNVFSPEVRDFFFKNATYKELHEKYGIIEGVIKNNIYRQVRKYYEIIGRDLYRDILDGLVSDKEAEVYVEDLKQKYDSMEKIDSRIEDFFYEDIFSGSKLSHDFSSISNEQFNEARDKISRLSKPATQFLINNLDTKLKDYIVYLLTTEDDRLVKSDKERKENLILFFKLENFLNKKMGEN